MIIVQLFSGGTPLHAGEIPMMLSPDNPKPAREQLDDGYQHGGGWRPMEGFTLGDDCELLYPGDPPFVARCGIALRDELIFIYDCGMVAIFQTDGTFEVARMD